MKPRPTVVYISIDSPLLSHISLYKTCGTWQFRTTLYRVILPSQVLRSNQILACLTNIQVHREIVRYALPNHVRTIRPVNTAILVNIVRLL